MSAIAYSPEAAAAAGGDRLIGARAGAAALVAFGLLAVALGQTDSWDLRNYHLYDGWAFWTGRAALDFAVAQAQTYFNPLLATATYLLFSHTPPWLSAFLLGALQGANLLPLAAIAGRLLPSGTSRARRLALAVAAVGALGTTLLGELGGSMGDTLVSLPLLCAFAIVLRDGRVRPRDAAAAGLLGGAAVGLKLTALPFAAGLFAALVLLVRTQPDRRTVVAAAALAMALAFALLDGFWLLRVAREFGNPLHPMFAGLFGGVAAPPVPLRDERFLPHAPGEWLLYPLVWLGHPHRVSNAWFFDLRVPLAFALAPLLLRPAAGVDRRLEIALTSALAIAYVCWLALFGVYRYLAPLEMLAPLLVALALQRLPAAAAPLATTALLVVMLVLVRAPGWGRLPANGSRFLDVAVPPAAALERATVVFAEDEPLAFLALGFPATTRFVRIAGNLMGPPFPRYWMDDEAARRIAASEGPLYAVLADPDAPRVRAALERQRLGRAGPCLAVHSNLLRGKFRAALCPLVREATP